MSIIKSKRAVLLLAAILFLAIIGAGNYTLNHAKHVDKGTRFVSKNIQGRQSANQKTNSNKITEVESSVIYTDDTDLARGANVIVLGRVKEVRPAFKGIAYTQKMRDALASEGMTKEQIKMQEEREANYICSDVVVSVAKYLKTDTDTASKSDSIVIRTAGGTAGGTTMIAERMTHFSKNDEGQPVLLYLYRQFDGILWPTSQGTFRIENDKAINEFFPRNNMTIPAMLEVIKTNNPQVSLSPNNGTADDSSSTSNATSQQTQDNTDQSVQ